MAVINMNDEMVVAFIAVAQTLDVTDLRITTTAREAETFLAECTVLNLKSSLTQLTGASYTHVSYMDLRFEDDLGIKWVITVDLASDIVPDSPDWVNRSGDTPYRTTKLSNEDVASLLEKGQL